MNLKSKLFDLFYDRAKLASFTARSAAIDTMTEKVEQLIAYKNLSREYDMTNIGRWQGKMIVATAFAGFVAATVAGSILAPASAVLYSLAGGSVFYAAFMSSLKAAAPCRDLANNLHSKQANLAEKVSIEAVAASPDAEYVLTVFPAIKDRFADAALRAVIKGDIKPQALRQAEVTKPAI